MLKIIAIVVAIFVIAIVIILVLALRKPDDFRVTRSITINAPAQKIFPLIDDLHAWASWSPYEVKDPGMARTFSGAPRGVGAIYNWDGNKNVGAGRMEITDTAVPGRIVIKLDFFKPFEGHNTAEFTLLPHESATTVTWTMYGPAPLMSKLMQVVIDMDHMIGKDFAIGLENLKSVAEK
jgi:Polyketide cyclase / dehydrase and lipid transport